MHYTQLFSEAELQDALDRKLVKREKHPNFPIYVYNYTATAQYEWEWNEVTLNCRGLVLDEEGNVIARPFRKFFTMEQLAGDPRGEKVLEKLQNEKFEVVEKMDGSLGVIFSYKQKTIICTRGSFVSDQAHKAYSLLPVAERWLGYDFIPKEGRTYLVEIIYPENRIVVDYKGYSGLVLLGVVDNETGLELYKDDAKYFFDQPKVFMFDTLEELKAYEQDNFEGFIVKFADGTRIKVKLEEYKRLHRLITGVSEKTIWEALKENRLEALLEGTPDEFYTFVEEVKAELESRYAFVEFEARLIYYIITGNTVYKLGRKEFALKVQSCDYPYKGLLFNIYDEKDLSKSIWSIVKPETTRVFKMIGEDNN